MKRLLIALAAAVAVSTASAIITDTQEFETSFDDFVAKGGDDESELATHESTPSVAVPYPCSGFGEKYLALDTGDATLWRTNAGDAAYIDMVMQFNPCTEAPTNAPDTKISVYLNSTSNLVVQAGDGAGGSSNYVTSTTLAPGTWARLTVASNGAGFDLYLDGTQIGNTYPSLTGDATICEVGFSGSGKLDDFVARTTDPYYSGDYVARIGTGEFYSTYSEALADALATTTQDAATIITRSNDQTSNGSESSPYRIEDAACLVALQNAVLVNPAVRSLHYVQTADIDMSAYDGFTGIGTTNTDSASGGVPFSGTYDGAGHKISNVKFSWRKYAGIFNQVNCATIKNLIGENLGFSETGSGEHGCAMVGNGIANLVALHSQYTVDFSVTNTHNAGGIMVRAMGGTTFTSCTNTADLVCCRDKMGGICCFDAPAANTTVAFVNCVNTGSYTLVTPPAASTYLPGNNGFAGILGYSQGAGNTTFQGCENTGSFVNNLDTTQFDNEVRGGELLGFCHSSGTISDLGGNKFNAANKAVHSKDAGTVGFAYATVDNGVATTVTTLAKDMTYLLTWDVAASETPVFTLAAVGDTIAFNTNGYAFAGTVAAAGDMVDAIPSTLDAVITYTATEAPTVATITKNDVTTPYRTLQDAIAAAESGDTVNLVENAAISGEVNIPADVTVVLASGVSLGNVTALSGTGVLFVPSGTVVPLVQTGHAASLLRDAEKWAGTLSIKDATMSGPDGLAYYGNANSTVRFENVWLINYSSSHAIGTLELVGAGVYIQTTSGNMTLPCALVGDGSISLRDASDTQRTVLFSGDVSAFAGNVTVATDTKSRIVFGTNASTQGNNNCIVVDSDASVTVAEGKTWTAPNGYVIKGTATVSGTLAAGSEKVYGTGCVIYTSATAAAASAPIAGSWTGTYVVGWAPTGAFNPNTYGNANSTVVLSNDLAASAYFGPGSATTLTINPTVRIAADVEIKNGYSKADDSCLVTFTKLTGDHKFSTSPGTGGTDANPTTRRYAITTLDNFTGSLKVKAGSELRIATVNVADGTNLSGLIIPAECDAKSTVEGAHTDGVITGALALTVAGVDSGKTLTYDANGAEGAGLYVVASSGGFDGGDGATFSIPAVTQSALAAVLPSGKTLADTADAASGMTYAQAYALGLLNETTGDVEDLKATIEVVDGKVKVSLDDATAGAAYTVTLKVYEKASLSAEWPSTPKATYALGNEGEGFTPGSGSATAGFYKVEVSISNK